MRIKRVIRTEVTSNSKSGFYNSFNIIISDSEIKARNLAII